MISLQRARRNGYVLVYIVIAIAVVAVVAVTLAPDAQGVADRALAAKTYAQLAELDTGIVKFGTVIKRVATVYPGAIHQLSNVLTTSDEVSCQNNAMTATSIANWNTNGGFSHQYITKSGLHTPIGTINDVIEHSASNAAMYLRIPAMDTALIDRMDALVDGGNGGAAGKILFTLTTSPTADLLYRVGFPPNYTLLNQC
jgi:type II secretory pathway pseudopilin PulG